MTKVVGVVGGGQLARMLAPAAINLGLDYRVFAENSSASARLAATHFGEHTDLQAVLAFASECDVVTFDHEHVPQEILSAVVAAGVSVQPSPQALVFAQDKLMMRERLSEIGVPVPGWARVRTAAEVENFLAEYASKAVAKTPRGGYDGKGVRVVETAREVADWLDALGEGESLLLEEFVHFRRELAQQIARNPSGEMALWPVVETVQKDGVCSEVIAPAPLSQGKISDMTAGIAQTIAQALEVTGVMAVELFETTDDRILVNELAMRPHNSGHWSMDGATTSQFEQHLRAVLDLPLGATEMVTDCAVMINILGGPSDGDLYRAMSHAMERHPQAKFHLYGKEPRPGRKVGHINVAGTVLTDVVAEARGAAGFFQV